MVAFNSALATVGTSTTLANILPEGTPIATSLVLMPDWLITSVIAIPNARRSLSAVDSLRRDGIALVA